MDNKRNLRQLYKFLLVGSTVWVYGIYNIFYLTPEKNEHYFKYARLDFKGTVVYKKEKSHGAGYVCLDLDTNSKLTNYNPSDSLSNYFCLVKDRKAILSLSGVSSVALGNLVSIKEDSIYIFDRNNKLKERSKLILADWIESPRIKDICDKE